MISRGRYKELYLYEVTEQDLLLSPSGVSVYEPGNVLIFMDKRAIELGQELARADDISAAQEYLENGEAASRTAEPGAATARAAVADIGPAEDSDALRELLSQKEETLRSLVLTIEQRDELLSDLAENLKIQRQDNELLNAMLDSARKQLAANELSQNELVDDLQMVSVEAMSKESTLELVLEEKFQLEQELAERITELVELNLINDDLQHQIKTGPALANLPEEASGSKPSPAPGPPAERALAASAESVDEAQIVTLSSGKQIHIYHEFPPAIRPGKAARFGATLATAVKLVLIVIAVALALLAVCVVATAQVNGISFGQALDLLIQSLGLLQ